MDGGQVVGGAFTDIVSLGSVQPEYKSYTAYYVLSGAVVAGGVYLLFASASNKRKAKAASVFIDMEKAKVLQVMFLVINRFQWWGLKYLYNRLQGKINLLAITIHRNIALYSYGTYKNGNVYRQAEQAGHDVKGPGASCPHRDHTTPDKD